MEDMILVEKIENLLSENNGRMAEAEVCKVLNITYKEIPWGDKVTWSKLFQPNQTYDLISRFYKRRLNIS